MSQYQQLRTPTGRTGNLAATEISMPVPRDRQYPPTPDISKSAGARLTGISIDSGAFSG
jgi:hypothetical protein